MNHDPDAHHGPRARMAGPRVRWARPLLATMATGRQGSRVPAAPVAVATTCGPVDPGAMVASLALGWGAIAKGYDS